MSTANSTPNRASLLAGLRTGGVRNQAIPHTAAPGGSFNIPRIVSGPQNSSVFPEEDGQYAQFAHHPTNNRAMPQTAAVDGGFFPQQTAPFSPFPQQPNHAQAQALQMQMMQIEIMRMQALQAQQYQAQMLAAQQPQRRPNFNPPATAGPTGSFDLRSATLNAQMRRNQHPENEQHIPMTAALDGKFGIRPNMLTPSFVGHFPAEPTTPQATTVISGGTPLGSPLPVVSKSETASNWRRGGNNSVLRGANRPMAIKTSPPPTERRLSPPPALASASLKARPGLSINSAAAQPIPIVAIDTSESENDDGYSTSSSDSAATNSPPTTPRSSSSIELTHRSSKENVKTAGGFALGSSPPKATTIVVISRQPRGPPSEAAEFASRNFASRGSVTVTVAA